MTDSEIQVTMPAETRFVAMARVTAASLAAELEFTIDEIEELRVGADELVALVVEWAEDHGGGTVDLRYVLGTDHVELHATAAARDPDASTDDEGLDVLTRRILDAVVDDYDLGDGSGHVVKRRSSS